MGGFFRGIGAAASGVGAAIPAWREQQLNQFQQNKFQLANMIQGEMNRVDDPVARAEYASLYAKTLNTHWGDDWTPIIKQAQRLGVGGYTHQNSKQLVNGVQAQNQQSPPTPGPATPGRVPGAAPPIPPVQQPDYLGAMLGGTYVDANGQMVRSGPGGSPPPTPSASTPADNPIAGPKKIQPVNVAPGPFGSAEPAGSPQATSVPPVTPGPIPGAAPMPPADNGGVGPLPPAATMAGAEFPLGPWEQMEQDALHNGTPLSDNARAAAVAERTSRLTNVNAAAQKLAEMKQGLAFAEPAAQQRMRILRQTFPNLDSMPPLAQTNLIAEYVLGNKNPIYTPAMARPVLVAVGAPSSGVDPNAPVYGHQGMTTAQYEKEHPGTQWRIERDLAMGTDNYIPRTPQQAKIDMENGGVGYVNPQAANVPPVQVPGGVASPGLIKPPVVTLPGGQTAFGTSPYAALKEQMVNGGAPVPTGGYNLAALPTAHSSFSQTSPTGERSTGTQSRKVFPGTAPVTAVTPVGPPSSASTPSSASPGGGKFYTQQEVDNAVQQLSQPNLSTAQRSQLEKDIFGNNKYLKEAVRQRMAQGGIAPIAMSPSMADQAITANQVQSHLTRINGLIDSMGDSKLGPIMGRWNEFMAGKVGAGDPEYAQLRVNMGLLETALGRVHGGARGGGSTQMLEHFQHLMNANKMDPQTLRSTLGEVNSWLQTYANPSAAGRTGQESAKPKVKIKWASEPQ